MFVAQGDPQNAMVYGNMFGYVSGGDYGEKDHKTCLPFAVPPSGSSEVSTVPTPKCPAPIAPSKDPPCDPVFAKAANKTWTTDKHKSGPVYHCNTPSAACFQSCLMGGPVETSMVVFGDIWSYKSGVYTCGAKKGGSGHSVVIIGWGKENGTVPYW